jgi:hypothetical protein
MSDHLRWTTDQRIGIWIDHERAVIVSASPDRVTINTLESEFGEDARYGEQRASPGLDGPHHESGAAKQEQDRLRLDRYYDEVITQLGHPQALLIFGPGEAKLQFTTRLSRFKALRECVVGLETTETLTDPEIVAKVREHYGIAREARLSVLE